MVLQVCAFAFGNGTAGAEDLSAAALAESYIEGIISAQELTDRTFEISAPELVFTNVARAINEIAQSNKINGARKILLLKDFEEKAVAKTSLHSQNHQGEIPGAFAIGGMVVGVIGLPVYAMSGGIYHGGDQISGMFYAVGDMFEAVIALVAGGFGGAFIGGLLGSAVSHFIPAKENPYSVESTQKVFNEACHILLTAPH